MTTEGIVIIAILVIFGIMIYAILVAELSQKKEMKRIMADLTTLITQVQATTDAETAAVQCIQGLAAQLEAAKGNQAAIDDIVIKMKASADALGAAIMANTTPPAPGNEVPS
jgi:hypothetical protein